MWDSVVCGMFNMHKMWAFKATLTRAQFTLVHACREEGETRGFHISEFIHCPHPAKELSRWDLHMTSLVKVKTQGAF